MRVKGGCEIAPATDFRNDLKAPITSTKEVLARALGIHYNYDYLVVPSTGFGGERYQGGRDTSGKMTGLTFPDGNVITLNYDHYFRLIEETDPLGRETRYPHHHLTTWVKQVEYPAGSKWQAQYDNKGDLIAELDVPGDTTVPQN